MALLNGSGGNEATTTHKAISDGVRFERHQGGGMDSLTTHKSPYYKNTFKEALKLTNHLKEPIIDLFARDCQWADITNDIDPNTKAKFHLDALDFIKSQKSNSSRIILFDPPFSSIQAERYEAGDTNLYASGPAKISKIYKNSFRVLVAGGVFVKLGYNSTRPHKGFKLHSLKIVNFGGSRNDVIVSIWVKTQKTLGDFS